MTTINNLIDQVGGIEKARGIVEGAPDKAHLWRDMDSVCTPNEILYYAWFGGALLVFEDGKGWVKSIYHDDNEYILDQLQDLNDLRTAIAKHDEGQNVMDKPKTYNEWHSSLKDFEGLRHANCCKISYEAGQQSRQAEVDEKDKRIGDQNDFIGMALNSLNHLKENAVTHRDYGHECNWVRSFNDLIKLADDAEDALKQALRGDDDINVTR